MDAQIPLPLRHGRRIRMARFAAFLWIVTMPAPAAAGLITVTSAADAGPGSLRAAILAANGAPGPDVIDFSTGSATITLLSNLPPLTDNRTAIRGETGPVTLQEGGYGGLTTGIVVEADSCEVRGLTITGFDRGVWVRSVGGSARRNRIGGIAGLGNTISANGEGIRLEGAQVLFNTVLGNRVDQTTATGIVVGNGCVGNTVGPDNVIIRSGGVGIRLTSTGASVTGNTLTGNLVGTDEAHSGGLGNGDAGIVIETAACSDNVVSGNLVVSNAEYGILLTLGAKLNDVSGNAVGIADGMARANRVGIGLTLNAKQNTIGPANVVSGNTEYGIAIRDSLTANNVITGNFVGLDEGGVLAVPNGLSGVLVEAAPNTVEDNRIGGNGYHGIEVVGPFAADYVTISTNRVGTNAAGTAAIGNANDGIAVAGEARHTRILDNLVAGNAGSGVFLDFGSDATIVQGNAIGVDATGTIVMPNDVGILVRSGSNTIGGSLGLVEGNTVGHNTTDGVLVTGIGAVRGEGNLIHGNTIESNGGDGVRLADGALDNVVGESADTRNVIRLNGGHGVRVGETVCVECPVGNVIRYNSITANGGDAIDLFSSTPAGNNGIPAPTVLWAGPSGVWGSTNLGGLATTIQIFSDSEDETETLLGEITVPAGEVLWNLPGSFATGTHLTATNTASYPLSADPEHTSEPADSVRVTSLPEVVIFNGIRNEALGGASVTLVGGGATPGVLGGPAPTPLGTAAVSEIHVSNLGSSGQDGVRLASRTSGGMVRFASLPDPGPGGPPNGTQLILRVVPDGCPPGDTCLAVVDFTYRTLPDRVDIAADFASFGIAVSDVILLDQGTPVARGQAPGALIGSAGHMPLEVEVRRDYALDPRPGWPASGPTGPGFAFVVTFPAGTLFDLPDLGGTVSGDELRVIADPGSAGFHTDREFLEPLSIAATAVPGPNALTEIVIVDEALVNFGRCQRGRGQALLNDGLVVPGTLVLSNIGSGGGDGVMIPWPDEDKETGFAWADPDPAMTSPPGWYLEQRAFGVLGGMAGELLASARITRTAGGYAASVDYAPMNADSVRFQVFDDGVLVGQAMAPAGSMAWLSDAPRVGRFRRGAVFDYWYDDQNRFTAQLPGGPPVMGDLLRIIPMNPEVEPTDWDDHLFIAKDVPGGVLQLTGSPNVLDLGGGDTASALGGAFVSRLGLETSVVAAGNLGMSGLDGVELSVGDVTTDLTWGPVGPAGSFTPGTFVEYFDRVRLPGGGTVRGGSILMDAALHLHADPSPLGAPRCNVRAYSGGMLMGAMDGVPNGVVATADAFAVGAGSAVGAAGSVTYWSKLPPGTMVVLGPGVGAAGKSGTPAAVPADLIMVVPDGAAVTPLGIVSAGVRAAEVPFLLVTERSLSVPVAVLPDAGPVRPAVGLPAPNPFTGVTRMAIELPRPGRVSARVFDLAGRLVTTLADDDLPAGRNVLDWDGRTDSGREASAGIYFVRIEGAGLSATARLVRIR